MCADDFFNSSLPCPDTNSSHAYMKQVLILHVHQNASSDSYMETLSDSRLHPLKFCSENGL